MPQEVESVLLDLPQDGQGKMEVTVASTLVTSLNMATQSEH
jgi:hypothetical protein